MLMQFRIPLLNRLAVRALAVLVLSLGVSSCGFHLRGNIPLPESIQNMYIDAPSGSFKEHLEEVLTNAGGKMANNAAGADVILKITKANTDRTVGTLDERGKADSYNLRFRVSYKLNSPDGKQIRKASLNESRRYNFDPEQVIESESEEAELQSDMEKSIALRVVRQLAALTSYTGN